MGCNNFQTEQTDKLVEASLRGENSGIQSCSPEIREEIEKNIPKIREELERANKRWERIESLKNKYSEIKIGKVLEPELACRNPKELIANASPDTVIISHGPEIPIFATDFKDSGQELSHHIKDYPKDFPEVKVYTPVLPTKENLERMLRGENPISPWGIKVNLHHHEQDPKGPLMMMGQSQHQKFSGVVHERGKFLSLEERRRYNRVERPSIWKMTAEAYLGKLTQDFKDVTEEKKEKNHE